MGERICIALTQIAPASDHLAVRIEHDRTHRHIARGSRHPCLCERLAHRLCVLCHRDTAPAFVCMPSSARSHAERFHCSTSGFATLADDGSAYTAY